MTPTEREMTEEETANRIKQLIEKIQAEEKELLDKVRNQAIDECLSKLTKHRWDTWDNQMAELEQLKTKP